MKHITIPEPVTIGDNALSLPQWLSERVWGHPYWRDTSGRDRQGMLFELSDKFEGVEAGDVVALTNEEHEALVPIATMRGEAIANPAAALPLQRLWRCFYEATSRDPRTEDSDEGGGKSAGEKFTK